MKTTLLQLKTQAIAKSEQLKAQAIATTKQVSRDLSDVKKFATDGCTGVPDFFFFECCENHDFGYEFGAELGALSRLQEDNALFSCMKRKLKKHNKNKGWMWVLPYIYWLGVRVIGWSRYNKGQQNG